MKKIEQRMLASIKLKRSICLENTRVEYRPAISNEMQDRIETCRVYLFENHIATVDWETGVQRVTANPWTLAKWPTPTTKSRLRALGVDVYTVGGVTYLNGVAV